MRDAIAPEPQPEVAASTEETFTILSGRADLGLVLFCDHAGNDFPPGYGTLGLGAADLSRHIAYDIGAAEVTRRLAAILGVPAIVSRYSRLLVDLNRGHDDPTLVMRLADGAVIPGNRHMDTAERNRRIDRYHEPYHRAADRMIDCCLAADVPPALLSIHSFTESWKGIARPWHASVLWDSDPRLALPLLGALRQESGLVVGDNEPYTGRLEGDTMWRHGTQRGLAHAIVEVRQDLVRDERGQAEWAERLARIMRQLLTWPELQREMRQVEHLGQHADLP